MFSVLSCGCFVRSVGVKCWVENEGVVVAAPGGAAPLHLDDQQLYCLLMCVLYYRYYSVCFFILTLKSMWWESMSPVFHTIYAYGVFSSFIFLLFSYVTRHDDIVMRINLLVCPGWLIRQFHLVSKEQVQMMKKGYRQCYSWNIKTDMSDITFFLKFCWYWKWS